MYNSGDAAEQVVRISLEGTEVALKLTGSAAKNIAAMLYTPQIIPLDRLRTTALRIRCLARPVRSSNAGRFYNCRVIKSRHYHSLLPTRHFRRGGIRPYAQRALHRSSCYIRTHGHNLRAQVFGQSRKSRDSEYLDFPYRYSEFGSTYHKPYNRIF